MVGQGHCGNTGHNEDGITTSYLHWATPKIALTGIRPTAVYNNTGSKKYEIWYEGLGTVLKYAYYDGSWHTNKNTNVSNSYDAPFVMKEDGKYYMVNYGPTNHKEFYIYTSDNGTTWAPQGKIYTYSGSWNKIDNPQIIKDGNIYRMYFQMKKSDAADTKYYIFEATSNAKSLKEIAYNAANNNTEAFTIVSGDKTGGSILEPGAEGEWDSFRVMQPMVLRIGNKGYLMMYTGYDKYDHRGKIGYATSLNGVNWKKVEASDKGYDTTFGDYAFQPSLVKTNDNLILFYQDKDGAEGKIKKTYLTNVLDSNNRMTLDAQEIKPFFIKNDFAINLKPMNYTIQTNVNPVTE